MLVLTAGMPSSGKTTFAKELLKAIGSKVAHLDPKENLPDDYESLSSDNQSLYNISAWEVCFEKAIELLGSKSNESAIIFDSAAAKFLTILPLLKKAKSRNHNILYVFMNAKKDDRLSWSTDFSKNIIEKLDKSYIIDFKVTLPAIEKSVDKLMIINNGKDNNAIKHGVIQALNIIKGITNG